MGLYDRSSELRASLAVGAGGAPLLSLNDTSGKPSVMLSLKGLVDEANPQPSP
jgi:hypothetical protein